MLMPKTESGAEVFKDLRKRLGASQGETAKALGISRKAVQSYEQGWRDVPERVLRQLLALVAVKSLGDDLVQPCWEVIDCPPEVQGRCLGARFLGGRFCWRRCGASVR